MKKLLGLVVLLAVLSLQAQAVYVDASTSNTASFDGSSPWYSTTNAANLWYLRTGTWANNDAGVFGQADGDVFESREDLSVKQLFTTISGLTAGKWYQIDVVYESKSLGENWNVTVDFSPITKANEIVTSGKTYGAVAETFNGVSILAGVNRGNPAVGGIMDFSGLIGTIAADANGQIKVYVDNCLVNSDANHRTWYDGLIVTEVPEPATMMLLGLGGLLVSRKKR